MAAFIDHLLNPLAVLMLYVLLYCLAGPIWGAYQNRASGNNGGIVWNILWFLLAVFALIAWVRIVFF